ncbi:MAG: BrnT family toxin [Terracidiphilus sp.]
MRSVLQAGVSDFGAAQRAGAPGGSKLPTQVTIEVVEITYDPQKHGRNLRERNLGFDEAAQFDFLSALYFGEVRGGENRIVGIGYLGKRLHVICFIPTNSGIRVISFRKANDREARKYGKPKAIDE